MACRWRRSPATRARSLTSCYAGSVNACRWSSVDEESHLHARKLNHIVVGKSGGLRPDRRAVQQREIVLLAAVHMDDVIALGPAGNGGNLYTGAAQCGQRLIELELAACEGA